MFRAQTHQARVPFQRVPRLETRLGPPPFRRTLRTPVDLEQRMRRDLMAAMKEKDAVTVRTLRAMLGAIANSEAVSLSEHDLGPGVGASRDVPRRVLTDVDRHRLLREEIGELQDAAAQSRELDQQDHAGRLDAQVEVLERYLSDS